jgi:acyl-CoA thioesterase-1
VKVTETWVALLERRLAAQGYGYRVANASVSGETTGGARTRLPRALEVHKPTIVIIELGGNDGLRGLPLRQIRANFEFMITSAQASGAQVMLIGMRMPANYGATYADQFHALFGELGKKYSVPVVEFFLEGVAQNSKLMQQDGIHPTAAAQELLLDNVWPVLKTVLKRRP